MKIELKPGVVYLTKKGDKVTVTVKEDYFISSNRIHYTSTGAVIGIKFQNGYHPNDTIVDELYDEQPTANKVKNHEADKRYGLWDDYQVIDIIKATLTKEEYIGALKFNILKYKLRDKGCDEADRIKAKDYQNELNELLKKGK